LQPRGLLEGDEKPDPATPVVSDQVRGCDPERIENRRHVGGEQPLLVAAAGRIAPTEAAQVGQDAAAALGERGQHPAPFIPVLRPAVQQQERLGVGRAGECDVKDAAAGADPAVLDLDAWDRRKRAIHRRGWSGVIGTSITPRASRHWWRSARHARARPHGERGPRRRTRWSPCSRTPPASGTRRRGSRPTTSRALPDDERAGGSGIERPRADGLEVRPDLAGVALVVRGSFGLCEPQQLDHQHGLVGRELGQEFALLGGGARGAVINVSLVGRLDSNKNSVTVCAMRTPVTPTGR
jgi:hypothetical protein